MRRTLIGFALFASLAIGAIWWKTTEGSPSSVSDPVRSAAPTRLGTQSGTHSSDMAADSPVSWEGVNLEQVRAALPDNRYWTEGLPTRDEDVLANRERAAEQRNLLYGKILSGTATGAEIDAYYDERQRTSEDYVAFSRYVLQNYGAALTGRDTGLLELARSMNEERLAQLPDERLRGHARKQQQDRARAEWNDQRPGG